VTATVQLFPAVRQGAYRVIDDKVDYVAPSDRGGTRIVKLRAPGFSNLSLFAELARGTLLADAVSILGSLDLVIPEIDR